MDRTKDKVAREIFPRVPFSKSHLFCISKQSNLPSSVVKYIFLPAIAIPSNTGGDESFKELNFLPSAADNTHNSPVLGSSRSVIIFAPMDFKRRLSSTSLNSEISGSRPPATYSLSPFTRRSLGVINCDIFVELCTV